MCDLAAPPAITAPSHDPSDSGVLSALADEAGLVWDLLHFEHSKLRRVHMVHSLNQEV